MHLAVGAEGLPQERARHAGVRGGVEAGGAGHGAQRLQAHVLVVEGLAHGAVLLGLDDEPAGVAVLGGDLQHRLEGDAALGVARHGEGAAAHALEEGEVLLADLPHDLGADVLGVDVGDAVHVLPRHLGRVGAAEGAVAGVEQEPGVRAGHRHEAVDVGGGLDDRAHVVVVAHLHALLGGEARQLLVAGGEALPLGVGHDRAVVHRHLVVAVDGVGALAGVDVVAARRLGEVDPGLERALLGVDVVDEEVGRVPAGGEAQAVLGELGLQRGALVGHLVALLDAVEADPAAVAEAVLEAQVVAEGPVVVVRPGDGVGSVEDHGRRTSVEDALEAALAS